ASIDRLYQSHGLQGIICIMGQRDVPVYIMILQAGHGAYKSMGEPTPYQGDFLPSLSVAQDNILHFWRPAMGIIQGKSDRNLYGTFATFYLKIGFLMLRPVHMPMVGQYPCLGILVIIQNDAAPRSCQLLCPGMF